MDWSDMTEEEIAGGCELDVRTIQRIRNDDNQSPSVETIIQLCVAMRLPPQVSRVLISKGGYIHLRRIIKISFMEFCWMGAIYPAWRNVTVF